MKQRYILDSSAWIAYVVNEEQTQAYIKKIETADQLVVPITVIEEIGAVLHHRFSNEAAQKSCSYLTNSTQCQVVSFNQLELQHLVSFWKTLPNYIDFVDASVILLQQQLNLPILSLDQHFQKMECKLAV